MISQANHLILNNAVQAVQAQRASQAAAAQSMSEKRLGLTAKAKPAAAKKPAAKKPAKAASSPGVTPYLTATDLMGANDQVAAAENANTASRGALTSAAFTAIKNAGDIERARVQNVSDVNNDAAARGIYRSGIRYGGVGMANSGAARGQLDNRGALALAAQQSVAQQANTQSQLTGYQQALVAKAAENGAALPVDPYQNGATNVRGAATKKKVTR